jgi:hypothetical protein
MALKGAPYIYDVSRLRVNYSVWVKGIENETEKDAAS